MDAEEKARIEHLFATRKNDPNYAEWRAEAMMTGDTPRV
jgi:hypothetical protein